MLRNEKRIIMTVHEQKELMRVILGDKVRDYEPTEVKWSDP